MRSGLILAPVALLGLAAAAGQDEAPRRPPEPFRVFVHTSGPGDNALRAALEDVLPMVRERVERRRRWFQLADSAEAADLTLRLVNYRTGQHEDPLGPGSYVDVRGREFHFLDAIVLGGGERARLSGLDERDFASGPGLRNAASHLAEELEKFCKENYAALTAREPREQRVSTRDRGAWAWNAGFSRHSPPQAGGETDSDRPNGGSLGKHLGRDHHPGTWH